MFQLIKSAQEIIRLVRMTNDIARAKGETPRFGYLFTNRSFLVPLIGAVINLLIILQVPFLLPVLNLLQSVSPDLLAEHIIAFITAVSLVWSVLERAFTTAKVIITRRGAEKALEQVVGDDALAQALKEAVRS